MISLYALVRKLVGLGKSVLEIGSASGCLSRCFVEAGCEVLAFHAGTTRRPPLLVNAWSTLCAVHLIFKIAPQKESP